MWTLTRERFPETYYVSDTILGIYQQRQVLSSWSYILVEGEANAKYYK